MKQLLITIAAVVLVGCGESQQSATTPEAKPIARVAGAKAPDISIHDAAKKGNIEAVKKHLAAGTDVNAKEWKHRRTPLHFAADNGRKEIVELLINNGANVNVKEEPLGLTLLHQAAWDECIDTAQVLINNGADLNAKDTRGRTPLHSAAIWGQVEMLKILILAGADVNARTIEGLTPLHLASNLFSNKSTIEQLIENGANLNAKDNNGKTPLDTAISNSLTEIVKFLIKQGGTFFIAEFHPVLDILDEKTQFGYFFDENTPTIKEVGSYTDGGENMNTEYCWWNHSLSEIFVALESNGLKLQSFAGSILGISSSKILDKNSFCFLSIPFFVFSQVAITFSDEFNLEEEKEL